MPNLWGFQKEIAEDFALNMLVDAVNPWLTTKGYFTIGSSGSSRVGGQGYQIERS
jgi:hypothetical protein